MRRAAIKQAESWGFKVGTVKNGDPILRGFLSDDLSIGSSVTVFEGDGLTVRDCTRSVCLYFGWKDSTREECVEYIAKLNRLKAACDFAIEVIKDRKGFKETA